MGDAGDAGDAVCFIDRYARRRAGVRGIKGGCVTASPLTLKSAPLLSFRSLSSFLCLSRAFAH